MDMELVLIVLILVLIGIIASLISLNTIIEELLKIRKCLEEKEEWIWLGLRYELCGDDTEKCHFESAYIAW